MRKLAGWLLVTVMTMLGTGPALAAPKYVTKIKYYTVNGTNDRQLHAAMKTGSSYFRHKHVYAFITSKPIIDGQYFQGNTCKLKGFRIRSEFTIQLPKLSPSARISASTRRRFNSFLKFIKRHEYKHRSDYIGCYRRAERKISSIRVKSCNTFVSRMNAILKREGRLCERIATVFDRAEAKRVLRQPFVRVALKQSPGTTTASKQPPRAQGKRVVRAIGENR